MSRMVIWPRLLVSADAGKHRFGLIFEQLVILAAQAAERLDGLRDFSLFVIEIRGPLVLIEADQGRVVLGDHLAETHNVDRFDIGQVAHDHAHAPLSFGRGEIEFRAGGAGGDNG